MEINITKREAVLTGSEDLGEDALLVAAVDVVGRLARFVGPIE